MGVVVLQRLARNAPSAPRRSGRARGPSRRGRRTPSGRACARGRRVSAGEGGGLRDDPACLSMDSSSRTGTSCSVPLTSSSLASASSATTGRDGGNMLSDTHPAKITGVSAGIRVAYVLPSISISLQHARLFPRLEYALTGFQPVHDTFNDAIGFGVAKQNDLFVFLLISLNQAVYH